MNSLYFWGKQLCTQTFQQFAQQIKKTQIQETIEEISCGNEHFVVRTQSKIYGCGSNVNGQLGISKRTFQPINLTMILLPNNIQVKSISCGFEHTLLLDKKGQVYSSGNGKNGVLGYGGGQSSFKFLPVMKNVIKISAGKDHNLALTNTKVYGWGNAKDGQLGFLNKRIFYSPKQLNVYPCSSIFAGSKFSFFITSKGVYGTGINHNNQLGLGHQSTVYTPKKLNIDQNIKKICGAHYCVAITNNNDGYIWGSGSFGQFIYPTKVQFLNEIKDISISNNFGILTKNNDEVLVWGSNTFGQIGLADNTPKQYVVENEILNQLCMKQICCGSNYAIGFTNNLNNKKYVTNLEKSNDTIKQIDMNKLKNSDCLRNTEPIVNFKSNIQKSHLFYQDEEKDNKLSNSFLSTKKKQNNSPKISQLQSSRSGSILQKLNTQNSFLIKSEFQAKKKDLGQNISIIEILNQNENLKMQMNKKNNYISKMRQEYLTLLDFVENNKFLSSIFGSELKQISNKGTFVQKNLEEKVEDQFSRQLENLKDILQSANKN